MHPPGLVRFAAFIGVIAATACSGGSPPPVAPTAAPAARTAAPAAPTAAPAAGQPATAGSAPAYLKKAQDLVAAAMKDLVLSE